MSRAVTTDKEPLRTSDVGPGTDGPTRPAVALVFPGQGAQHEGMATGLYRADTVFTEAMDEFFDLFGPEGAAIRRDWLSPTPNVHLDDPRRAQPLLFAIGHALGRVVLEAGVRPTALLGHSVGEMVAATLAGVFTLPDAVELTRVRIEAFADSPPGGMVAVAAGVERLHPYLTDEVVVGAVNSSSQTLICGPDPALREVEEQLAAAQIVHRRSRSTVAFHSPAMADHARRTVGAFSAVRLNGPSMPVYSTVTGTLMTREQATSPDYWAMQPAEPVLFAPALHHLLSRQHKHTVLVEAGPGQGLSSLARRHPSVRPGGSSAVALLPKVHRSPEEDLASLRRMLDLLVVPTN